ncbi:hypothetical protein ABZ468_21670 [Streptomyces sp. NPDC005708]|uniref:hypothetical protein n=1 Tax=Streptomyces sp. NPDC005708 TaxID=3154564 RepID=UPI0033F89948
MSQTNHLRLLPWSGPEGKPAHLITDGTETYLARLADRAEAQMIETAAVILGLTKPMIEESANLPAHELRWAARRLIESLTDVLNICESRGQRIPPYDSDGNESDDQPETPAPSTD